MNEFRRSSFLFQTEWIMPLLRYCFLLLFIFTTTYSIGQDSSVFKWKVISKKLDDKTYELHFSTSGARGWHLYAPNQLLSDVATTELAFADSSIKIVNGFTDSG